MKKLLVLLGLLVSSLSFSEDIELYISETVKQLGQRPQVLIIFDNSGSMGTVESVNEDYDPNTVYEALGNDNSLDERFIYFTKGGVDGASLPVPDKNNESRRFLDEINSCKTARDILAVTGFYTGHIREYSMKGNDGSWKEIPDNNGANIEVIDCEDDVVNKEPTNIDTLPEGYPVDSLGDKQNPIYHTSTLADSNVSWSGDLVTLYTDNYLRWHHGEDIAQTLKTRLDQAKKSISDVIKAAPSVDFGLQVFNYNDGDAADDPNGGRIAFGIEELNDTNQAALLTLINDELTANTWTPLCESLYEAYNYFAGKAVDFGDDDESRNSDGYTKNEPPRDTDVEDADSNYITPFSKCNAKAYVILITDGEPTYDTGADTKIEAITTMVDGNSFAFNGTKYSSNYLAGLAGWMNSYDVNLDLEGSQKVSTFTIGFSSGADDAAPLLKETASRGGGKYFKASDSTQLTAALLSALGELEPSNDSLTSASVAANNFDRTETLNAVYYAMFDPQNGPRWQGNVKKYKVKNKVQVGQGDVAALNDETGHFSESVTSFWSTTNSKDGDKVAEGGVADKLRKTAVADRTLYTDNATSTAMVSFTRENVETANGGTAAALATQLGVAEDDIDSYLNWAKGLDVDDEDEDDNRTETRYDVFADPLHSKPLVINYGNSIRIVIGTNAGVLHMFTDDIATDTVSETWAFMPKEFFSNIKPLRDNYASADKVYGIDGKITSYFNDADGDGIVNGSDKVYIFFGLRRGGDSYYGIDVTDPTSPSLLWKIDSSTDGFSELGQSWSQPKLTYSEINITGSGDSAVPAPVLIFGGGYDPVKDASGPGAANDSSGRAIYMVDAKTGTLKWSLTPSEGTTSFAGKDSIPSSIGVLDSDGNGLVDRLYTGDTGGNVWRVDLKGADTDDWSVFKLAELGGDTTNNSIDRRFFNEPDIVRTFITETLETSIKDEEDNVTKVISKQNRPYEAILIGSGDRSNPLGEDTQDSFFMLKDEHIRTQTFTDDTTPSTPEAIPFGKLYNFTHNPFGKTLTGAQREALELEVSKHKGWYYNFDKESGEKNSASSIVINGVAYFTSFIPPSDVVNADVCVVPNGQGWLHAVDLAQGTKKYNWLDSENPDGITDGDERKVYISEQFLGSPTLIVVPEDDGDDDTIDEASGNIIVGRRIIPVGFNLQTLRTSLYIKEEN